MENETKPVYASFLLFFKCLDLQGPFLVSLLEIMQKAQFNNEMNKILGTQAILGSYSERVNQAAWVAYTLSICGEIIH